MEGVDINKEESSMLSTDEFQNKLIIWFEEKGILSELRTYLRHQMIETLKDSPLGRKISSKKKGNLPLSPKHQAVNLLIAEYLLQQGYQYSMSVFSSEVGTLYSLPQQALYENHQIKFHSRDVCDILESLGLPMDYEEAQSILSVYSQGNGVKDCLLLCLLRMLPVALRSKHNNLSDDGKRNRKDVNQGENQEKQRIKCTDSSTQPDEAFLRQHEHDLESILLQIHENMQRAFDHEIEIMQEEEKQKCLAIVQEKEKLIQEQLDKERNDLKKAEIKMKEGVVKKIEAERKKIVDEYRMKEIDLERKVAKELEMERYKILNEYREIINDNKKHDVTGKAIDTQHDYLNRAIDMVQSHSNKLQEKEELLNIRLKEAEEKLLQAQKIQYDKQTQIHPADCDKDRNEDRISIEKLKLQLENVMKQMKKYKISAAGLSAEKISPCKETQTDTPSIPTINEAKVSENVQTPVKSQPSSSNLSNNKLLEDALDKLRKENSYLKSLTTQQNTKIEELMLKQLNMSVEVNEAKVQVHELSKQLGEFVVTVPSSGRKQTVRELLSGKNLKKYKKKTPHAVNRTKKLQLSISGSSSEEVLLDKRRYSKNKQSTPQSKNKMPAHHDGDESPTDEILKEAKIRLKMLELESEAVDRSYQEFKMRQHADKEKGNTDSSASSSNQHKTKLSADFQPKTDIDISLMKEYSSPVYNTYRRVHESTMNIDKNLLHNYVAVNSIKHNLYPATKPLFSTAGKLTQSYSQPPEQNTSNRFSGTTALLLKRIENCTSNYRKYNMNEKKYNTFQNDLVSETMKELKSNIKNKANTTLNSVHDEYSKYIGRPDQQYKIKPLIHWRNIHKVQRITNRSKSCDSSDDKVSCESDVLEKDNKIKKCELELNNVDPTMNNHTNKLTDSSKGLEQIESPEEAVSIKSTHSIGAKVQTSTSEQLKTDENLIVNNSKKMDKDTKDSLNTSIILKSVKKSYVDENSDKVQNIVDNTKLVIEPETILIVENHLNTKVKETDKHVENITTNAEPLNKNPGVTNEDIITNNSFKIIESLQNTEIKDKIIINDNMDKKSNSDVNKNILAACIEQTKVSNTLSAIVEPKVMLSLSESQNTLAGGSEQPKLSNTVSAINTSEVTLSSSEPQNILVGGNEQPKLSNIVSAINTSEETLSSSEPQNILVGGNEQPKLTNTVSAINTSEVSLSSSESHNISALSVEERNDSISIPLSDNVEDEDFWK